MEEGSLPSSTLTTLRVIPPGEPPPGPSLLIVSEGLAEQRLLAGPGPWVIGRELSCEVQIDHRSLSRRHLLLRSGSPWTIEDLGGINGTKLGGRALRPHEPSPLLEGTVAELGLVTLVLRLPGEAPRGERAVAPGALDRLIERVAASEIGVVIQGETGAGKEVCAERLHQASPRRGRPLVKINCAAIPEALVESELFGHEKGAFSGAAQAKAGLLEAAQGGTVLLDEIGELPLPAQAKLLRAVEEHAIQRLGATTKRPLDARFFAATNRDLRAEVEAGRFRRDLYFRLNGITLLVPPLRERTAEIEPLAAQFAAQAAAASGQPPLRLSAAALARLRAHSWPGNVRELRNVIARALVLAAGDEIDDASIVLDGPSPGEAPPSEEGSLREARQVAERAAIVEALARAGGNQTEAAKLLGLSRRMLLYKLNALRIDRPRPRR